uniref:Bardet-Biedl syndrome 4 protein (inferred by orthology to a human protein) n=1 Tax=Strongyloides venezuelensis TaxID=75913 RepID=A0A0K0F2R7_STRVS
MNETNKIKEDIEKVNEENNNNEEDEEIEVDNEKIISEDELEPSPRRKAMSSGRNIKELALSNENIQKVLKLSPIMTNNQEIYYLYSEKNIGECKQLIEETLKSYNSCNEYATQLSGAFNLQDLNIVKSLNCYESAFKLNSLNIKYLMDMGRINYLVGNHGQALIYFTKILQISPKNWKAYCWKALSIFFLKKKTPEACNNAIETLLGCSSASKNAEILSLIAFFCREKGDLFSASEALKKASEIDNTNIELLKELGYDYIKLGSEELSFAAFGKALTSDKNHIPSLIGVAYIIQNNGDYDVALTKYRHATSICNYSGILWNNIGMCFYGKGKYIAAISCLKKADYLIPQNWEILFNMGLAYNGLAQYASAYQYISAALNLQPKKAFIFEALAVVLSNLEDFDNARKAFKRALSLDKDKTIGIYLNFAVFEYKRGNVEDSKTLLNEFYQHIEKGSKVDLESSYLAQRLRRLIDKSK